MIILQGKVQIFLKCFCGSRDLTSYLLYIRITQIPKSYNEYNEAAKLNFPDSFVHFARTIPKLLKQGLTNRVNLIAVNYNKLPSWSTSERPKTYISSNINLYIGLIFNPDESNRLVDY